MLPKITFRRSIRPMPSKFFEHTKIGGPRNNVRYFYVGKTIIKLRTFPKPDKD